MSLVAPAGPVYQAGTLSGNPLAMTAGLWALEQLSAKLYRALDKLGAALQEGLLDAATKASVAVQINRIGSLLTPFFTHEPVVDYRTALTSDTAAYRPLPSGDARARRVSAAVAVRGVVPVRGAHAAPDRQDDCRGARGVQSGLRSVV